jgi:hypothetical protein
MTQLHCAGLSHSEIRGSKVICTYPQLFAAYHVLHRLPKPRHPPSALAYAFYIFKKNYLYSLNEKKVKIQSDADKSTPNQHTKTYLLLIQYVKDRSLLKCLRLNNKPKTTENSGE